MSRPGGRNAIQRSCYSGRKRFHCLIHQTVTTPDGLLFHMYGPEVGRRHDMTLYRQSGIDEQLEQHLYINNKQYCLYGDPAYVLRAWLLIAFDRNTATADELLYNKGMSSVREAVDCFRFLWTYKYLKQIWTSQDFTVQKDAPSAQFATCNALQRCCFIVEHSHLHTEDICIQKSSGQVSTYFDCRPPTLSRYLTIQ